MNFHNLHHTSQLIVKNFESASLINADGKLIASSDNGQLISTTSRLVIFQIVKKYLPIQIGDLIIVNDPENGGLDFKHIFFVSRLTEQLYFVFVKSIPCIDFKIPPTPLYEKGVRNKLIWSLLVEQNPHADQLSVFFENAYKKFKSIQKLKKELQFLSDSKNQIFLFKVIQQIFEKKFNNNALGSVETIYKLSASEQIKMKLTIDEKLNQRSILIDFSQTSLAGQTSAASHVVESVLIYKLAHFYQMSDLISQPLLDHIRLSLPPKSIVSKATPTGVKNLYMQRLISENLLYLFESLSLKSNKTKPAFDLSTEVKISFDVDADSFHLDADVKNFHFQGLDQLIQDKKLVPVQLNYLDNKIHLKFKVGSVQKFSIATRLRLGNIADNFLLCNSKIHKKSDLLTLKQGDDLEINWKLKS